VLIVIVAININKTRDTGAIKIKLGIKMPDIAAIRFISSRN
jgi:hypothetical protein